MLFQQSGVGEIEPNRLHIHIQPDEAISFEIKAKAPGAAIRLEDVRLSFDYKSIGADCEATGYERLLYDALTGDSTLFYRTDMVEAAWRIATPILDVWSGLPARDLPDYRAGSWGPRAADDLLGREGRMGDGVKATQRVAPEGRTVARPTTRRQRAALIRRPLP
jgi:glucose-6-phosphate 1-dehydrogenase